MFLEMIKHSENADEVHIDLMRFESEYNGQHMQGNNVYSWKKTEKFKLIVQ